MINKREILDILDKKIKRIEETISSAKIARDMAPSAMESHSDTTRSEKEKLIFALESELNRLKETKVEEVNLAVYEVALGRNIMKVCLVPEGLGGENIEDIKLISLMSPLGKILKEKKVGEKFGFNNSTAKILAIQK